MATIMANPKPIHKLSETLLLIRLQNHLYIVRLYYNTLGVK